MGRTQDGSDFQFGLILLLLEALVPFGSMAQATKAPTPLHEPS